MLPFPFPPKKSEGGLGLSSGAFGVCEKSRGVPLFSSFIAFWWKSFSNFSKFTLLPLCASMFPPKVQPALKKLNNYSLCKYLNTYLFKKVQVILTTPSGLPPGAPSHFITNFFLSSIFFQTFCENCLYSICKRQWNIQHQSCHQRSGRTGGGASIAQYGGIKNFHFFY